MLRYLRRDVRSKLRLRDEEVQTPALELQVRKDLDRQITYWTGMSTVCIDRKTLFLATAAPPVNDA